MREASARVSGRLVDRFEGAEPGTFPGVGLPREKTTSRSEISAARATIFPIGSIRN